MNWDRFYLRPRPAKSQAVRVLDVAVIGPLMIWGGAQAAKSSSRSGQLAGAALSFFGLSTMIYNAINYAKVERGEEC